MDFICRQLSQEGQPFVSLLPPHPSFLERPFPRFGGRGGVQREPRMSGLPRVLIRAKLKYNHGIPGSTCIFCPSKAESVSAGGLTSTLDHGLLELASLAVSCQDGGYPCHYLIMPRSKHDQGAH